MSELDWGGIMFTILCIILALALLGALPVWRYSTDWPWFPSGILGAVLVILLVLFLLGRI
jgi:p-aminobenzoyl-glutamate transporter AbgT